MESLQTGGRRKVGSFWLSIANQIVTSPQGISCSQGSTLEEEKGRESLELDENSEKGKQKSKSRSGE